MRLTSHSFAAACLLLSSLHLTASAHAADAGTIPAITEFSAFGERVSDADLSTYRGGSALQINEMSLDSKLLNNQAIANVTGNNFVTQDAFAGASGFSTVVQNSGNNVIIQNATILNISLH